MCSTRTYSVKSDLDTTKLIIIIIIIIQRFLTVFILQYRRARSFSSDIFFTAKHTYIVGTLRAVDMRTLPCFVAFRATEKAVTSVHGCPFVKLSFCLGFYRRR